MSHLLYKNRIYKLLIRSPTPLPPRCYVGRSIHRAYRPHPLHVLHFSCPFLHTTHFLQPLWSQNRTSPTVNAPVPLQYGHSISPVPWHLVHSSLADSETCLFFVSALAEISNNRSKCSLFVVCVSSDTYSRSSRVSESTEPSSSSIESGPALEMTRRVRESRPGPTGGQTAGQPRRYGFSALHEIPDCACCAVPGRVASMSKFVFRDQLKNRFVVPWGLHDHMRHPL
jgi:hypothetical protein